MAMILPLTLAALPTSLLVADHESGWEQFVGVFPLSKGKIVLARYLFCLLLIILVSGLVLALSLVAHAIFGQYSLELHLIIVAVGLLFGILYVAVLFILLELLEIRSLGKITKKEILAQAPDISKTTVERTLLDLRKKGKIIKVGRGRATAYIKKTTS